MPNQVTVKLYIPFSSIAGCKETALEISEPISRPELFYLLAGRFPKLAPYLNQPNDPVMLVINGRLAREMDIIQPGDEVHLCASAWGG